MLLTAFLITPPARAAEMTTSDACVGFIKEFEGFRSQVYWDGGSARIGYGTGCKSTDYPNGISEEKAEDLLRQALGVKEPAINSFLSKYNITLTQNQYDAILSLTYNLGTMWMDSDYTLYSYLKNGIQNYSDIEIVNAIATWCHAGGKVVNIRFDDVQAPIVFDDTGKITTDKATVFKTKRQLGNDYGMKKASGIGKEWFEQVDAIEKWMTGKTADQIKAMKVKTTQAEGNVADEPDLASGATIGISDFIEVAVAAIGNAK
jgi:GH24 family phage-related lysozyme (muramidase)